MNPLAVFKGLFNRSTPVRPSEEEWASGALTLTDLARTKWSTTAGDHEMILRGSGWINICASLRSIYSSSVPIHLYTKAGQRNSKRWNCRPVKSRTRNAWLRNPIHGKAAQHADAAGEVVEILKHPFLDMLQKPNANETGVQFRRASEFYKLICGKAFWACIGDSRGRPIELRQLTPQHTVVLPGSDGQLIGGYGWGRNRGHVEVWDAEDVAYLRHRISPLSPLEACGPLHGIIVESDVLASSVQFELHLWNNSARPDYAIEVAPGTTEETIKQIRQFIRKRHQGINKAGEPIIAAGLKVQPLMFNQREMQYVEGREQLVSTIKSAFGMCGILDDQSASISIGSNGVSSAETLFYRVTVIPDVVSICEELTEFVLPWFGEEPGDVWCSFDNPVAEDRKQIAELNVALCNAGLRTIDEGRAELGDEPLPNGMGAVPRYNGQVMTKEPPQALGMGSPFGGGGGFRMSSTDDGGATDGEPSGGSTTITSGKSLRILPQAPLLSSRIFHGDWDHNHGKDRTETGLVPREQFRELIKGVEEWINSIAPSVNGSRITFDEPAVIAAFQQTVSPSLLGAFTGGFEQGAGQVNDAVPNPDNARGVFDDYTLRLAREVSGSVKDRMEEILRSTADTQQTTAQIGQQLQDAMGGEAYYMAERVARTELANVHQTGLMAAWKQTGGAVVGKRFKLAPGACELCQAVAAHLGDKVYPIDAPFFQRGSSINVGGRTVVFDFRDVTTGTIHPNDRCSVEPVFDWEVEK